MRTFSSIMKKEGQILQMSVAAVVSFKKQPQNPGPKLLGFYECTQLI